MLLCASLLLIAYGTVRLFFYVSDWVSAQRTTQELREIARETDTTEKTVSISRTEPPALEVTSTLLPSTPQPEETPALSVELPVIEYPNGYNLVPRIQKLRKRSEYIIGWITMNNLDEPVAKKNNTFFLNHDATGKRNSNGAIFMDEGTSLLTRPYTILLYGHNMKNGTMFGSLRKYENFSYYYLHRVFQFDTLYEEGQYVIFAVETISLTPGKVKYVNLTCLESLNRETRRSALQALMNQSLHGAMLDVNEEDQILLLMTCVGNDDERLILAARRLREEETVDRLIMK